MNHVIRCFDRFEDLPGSYEALRDGLARYGLFGDPGWFDLLLQHSFEGLDRLCVLAVEDGREGRPLMLVPLRVTRHDGAARGALALATINHVENFATPAFVFDDSVEDPDRLLEWLFRQLRRRGPEAGSRPPDLIRLMPMAEDSALGELLYHGLRAAGWPVQPFANSFNRYEDTTGLSHAEYFERRSANLRYSVRRRRRALDKTGSLELAVVRDARGLERALLDYLKVTQTSWKDPRTMADPLTLAMIRLAAARGDLRLGILRLGGEAAAAQFWLVAGGTAHCVRLAYDQRFGKQAVGVVLTDFMIEHLLDDDHVERLDFGFGDEDYKASWMGQERVFFGLIAFNTRTWTGRWQALRHLGGQPVKRALRQLRDRLGWGGSQAA